MVVVERVTILSMKNNRALIECKGNFFTKLRKRFSFFFNKHKASKSRENNLTNENEVKYGTDEEGITEYIYDNEKSINSTILNSDFNVLSNLVNKKNSIDEIDIETEKRLIKLCARKSKELDEKLDKLDNEIIEMNIALNTIKKISM